MKTIGDRITYCRSSLNLTRQELVDLWQETSIATLARWELDSVKTPEKKIKAIADFFCSKGLLVSLDWLKLGIGPGPTQIDLDQFTQEEFDNSCEAHFSALREKTENFFYYKVTSHFFSPIIKIGDYAAGIWNGESHLGGMIDQLVMIIESNTVYVGLLDYVNNKIILKNTRTELMEFSKFNKIIRISWTALRPS